MSLVEIDAIPDASELRRRLELQRAAFANEPFPTLATRRDRLDRILDLLRRHRDAITEAVSADFGHRSRHETLIADIVAMVNAVRDLRRNVGRWMRPQRRGTTLALLPARAEVIVQPLGVVGVIGPWNYPVLLQMLPVATALAAGNRTMVKLSETAPRTAVLLAKLLADRFPEDLVACVTGGPDVGEAFSRLPFDHLVFTGSTAVGRLVAAATARQLVPVTLELGGKSPVIVHPDFPVDEAATNIVANKLFNAGQTCVAPDYALVHEGGIEAFVDACRRAANRLYPEGTRGPDYTSIVDERHAARLVGLVDDARRKGARVVPLFPHTSEEPDGSRRMIPVVVCDVTDEMALMKEEIFGPILPIVAVGSPDEAIRYVNARPRPLALYVFDRDRGRVDQMLRTTHTGTAAVNDCMTQFGEEHLPFGGIGPSGIGVLHGRDGFDRLSHHKGVLRQPRWNLQFLRSPPYGRALDRLIDWFIG